MTAVVETRDGRVRGEEVDGLCRFLGIPFAATTAGAGRWRAPAPAQPWTGERDATAFGPVAPQPDGMLALLPVGAVQDEDCLTLNVWTPGVAGRRPVMVWVHGGAFRQGAARSAMYDGAALARRGDVVVVSLNYRLGALGFLAHPDLRDGDGGPAGNWGMLDQVAALQWVRDNIAAFGGDPGNVTVFGESAGSMAIGCLLASPSTKGLLHKAILQSGAPSALALDQAAEIAERLAKAAGVTSVAELRDVPVPAILAAQQQIDAEDAALRLIPSVDGHFLDRAPLAALASGAAAHVPTVIGTNRDEWKLWAPADPRSRDLDDAGLRRRLSRVYDATDAEIDALVEEFTRARAATGQPIAPNDLSFALETERDFRAPAMRTAETLAAHQPATFAYLFTYGSPAMHGWLGACHALEIAFVFGTQGQAETALFTGSGPEADRLSEWLMDSWLAFARTGDPSTEALGRWPGYDARRRPTLVIGTEHAIVDAPYDDERGTVAALLYRDDA
jgi:para-nitrobenzyl esterase